MTGDQTPEYTIWPRYANSSVSVTTAQPVVQVNCRTHSGIPSNISTLVQQVHGPGEVGSDNGSSVRTQYFPPAWMLASEAGNTSLVGVFFAWRLHANESSALSLDWILTEGKSAGLDVDNRLLVEECTIFAYWNDEETQYVSGSFRSDADLLQTGPLSKMTGHSRMPITLDPTCIDANQSLELHRTMADNKQQFLSSAFAMGIAEYPRRNISLDFFKPSGSDANDSTAFTFVTNFYGYGYGTLSNSVIFSLVTISLYCVVVIIYITYILFTGATSTAWNSAIELVVLALKSRQASGLGHTSVGIGSLDTFKQGVGIRINKDNEFELVLERDVGHRDLRKIEKNKVY
jgi:hypothetical protein